MFVLVGIVEMFTSFSFYGKLFIINKFLWYCHLIVSQYDVDFGKSGGP